MPDSAGGPRWPAGLGPVIAALRWLFGLTLGAAALSFLVHGRAAFERLRQPDAARIVLASAEIAGAVLFLFRRTVLAGALVLLVVLAWAAGFHFALGLPSHHLWLYLAAVLALAAPTFRGVPARQL
jgi:hypothetical protein